MIDKADEFDRFLSKVAVADQPGACWEWTGNKPDGRYGHFSVNMKTVKAHRWIYQTIHGEIPDGLVVRHKCDNPSCVRPTHLEIGTQSQNIRDKFDRGRAPNRQGEKHPLCKLREADVLEIRRLARLGHTQLDLSQRFGVKRGQIGKIVQRINWRHLP